jgi:hypothetical protein
MILRIVATILFVMVVTPIALVMRLLSRDPLQRRLDSAADSYWTDYSQSQSADMMSQR